MDGLVVVVAALAAVLGLLVLALVVGFVMWHARRNRRKERGLDFEKPSGVQVAYPAALVVTGGEPPGGLTQLALPVEAGQVMASTYATHVGLQLSHPVPKPSMGLDQNTPLRSAWPRADSPGDVQDGQLRRSPSPGAAMAGAADRAELQASGSARDATLQGQASPQPDPATPVPPPAAAAAWPGVAVCASQARPPVSGGHGADAAASPQHSSPLLPMPRAPTPAAREPECSGDAEGGPSMAVLHTSLEAQTSGVTHTAPHAQTFHALPGDGCAQDLQVAHSSVGPLPEPRPLQSLSCPASATGPLSNTSGRNTSAAPAAAAAVLAAQQDGPAAHGVAPAQAHAHIPSAINGWPGRLSAEALQRAPGGGAAVKGAPSVELVELDLNQEVAELARTLQGPEACKLQLIDLIGQGAHGSVFRGVWHNLEVAVKTVMFTDRSAASAAGNGNSSKNSPKQRAITEAAVCASLMHPNVVCTYHYDITPVRDEHSQSKSRRLLVESAVARDYKLYLVQEYCDASLHAVLGAHILHDPTTRTPNMDLVLTVMMDVARGMQYIHSKNIIHGDLKPENVLLKNDSQSPIGVVAKVTDFGLSATLNPGDTHLSNIANGTPFYGAPEVVAAGKVTRSSDVYSFGVLMWETYRCMPPWIRTKAGYVANPHFKRFPRSVPAPFLLLCAQCLEKSPSARPKFKTILESLSVMHAALMAGYPGLGRGGQGSFGRVGPGLEQGLALQSRHAAAQVGLLEETQDSVLHGWYHGMPSIAEPPTVSNSTQASVTDGHPVPKTAAGASRFAAQAQQQQQGIGKHTAVPAQVQPPQQHHQQPKAMSSRQQQPAAQVPQKAATHAAALTPVQADPVTSHTTGVVQAPYMGDGMSSSSSSEYCPLPGVGAAGSMPGGDGARNSRASPDALQQGADRRAGRAAPARSASAMSGSSRRSGDDVAAGRTGSAAGPAAPSRSSSGNALSTGRRPSAALLQQYSGGALADTAIQRPLKQAGGTGESGSAALGHEGSGGMGNGVYRGVMQQAAPASAKPATAQTPLDVPGNRMVPGSAGSKMKIWDNAVYASKP